MSEIGNQQPKPRRLLAIKMRALGDGALLTGTLRVLQNRYPVWAIDVLTTPLAAPLFENLPFVASVTVGQEPRGAVSKIIYWLRLSWHLRKRHYDAVLVFHASAKTGFWGRFISFGQGLCVVNHHDLKSRNRFSQRPVPGRGEVKPNIDRDLDVIRALGEVVALSEAMPQLQIRVEESNHARETLVKSGRAGQENPLVFLGVGASRKTKRWDQNNFYLAMNAIRSKFKNVQFLLSTIDSDERWLNDFRYNDPYSSRVIHFKNLPLREVMALISQCHVYLGNDSGLKHVAVGLGVPTVTVFGPESPQEWHPYSQERHPILFIQELECRTANGQHWCAIENCIEQNHKCMKALSGERAAEMAIQQIEQNLLMRRI